MRFINQLIRLRRHAPALAMAGAVVLVSSACGSSEPTASAHATATPVYSKETGRLEQLVSDRDGDGKVETRAFMDGAHLKHIEIDRNGDGQPDRWEYYQSVAPGAPPPSQPVIERAEEAGAFDKRITRREFFVNGVHERVEEDTDLDGKIDKWEYYTSGRLARLEMDLDGKGFPNRRLIYSSTGQVERVEADPDGDGKFEPLARERGGQ